MSTVKVIVYFYTANEKKTLPTFADKIIGVYSSEKIEEGINKVKEEMTKDGKILKSETKDCCDFHLEYEEGESIHTESFNLNELFI